MLAQIKAPRGGQIQYSVFLSKSFDTSGKCDRYIDIRFELMDSAFFKINIKYYYYHNFHVLSPVMGKKDGGQWLHLASHSLC